MLVWQLPFGRLWLTGFGFEPGVLLPPGAMLPHGMGMPPGYNPEPFSPAPSRRAGSLAFGVESPLLSGTPGSGAWQPGCLTMSPGSSSANGFGGFPGLPWSPGIAGGPLAVPPGLGSPASLPTQPKRVTRTPQQIATVADLPQTTTERLMTRLCGRFWHPCVLRERTREQTSCALAVALNWYQDTPVEAFGKEDAWIEKAISRYTTSSRMLDNKSLDEIVQCGKKLIAEHEARALRALREKEAADQMLLAQHRFFLMPGAAGPNPAALYQSMMQSPAQQHALMPATAVSNPVALYQPMMQHPAQQHAFIPRTAWSNPGAQFPPKAYSPMLQHGPYTPTTPVLQQMHGLAPGLHPNAFPTMPGVAQQTRDQSTPPEQTSAGFVTPADEGQLLEVVSDADGVQYATAVVLAKRRRLQHGLYEVCPGNVLHARPQGPFSGQQGPKISMWDLFSNLADPWPVLVAVSTEETEGPPADHAKDEAGEENHGDEENHENPESPAAERSGSPEQVDA